MLRARLAREGLPAPVYERFEEGFGAAGLEAVKAPFEYLV